MYFLRSFLGDYMNLKAVIFDLDGVICHTDDYHYQAWNALADRLGIPFDQSVNDRLRGVSRMESLDIVLERSSIVYSEAEKLSLAEEKNIRYQSFLMQMTPADLDREVEETLYSLRELGLQLAIGSSSRNTPLILDRLGLGTFFDAVADGNQIAHSKPDPEVFLLAASKLNISPSQSLVVEDAAAGIQAAKAGGFLSAGIGDAADCSETDFPISSFRALIPICASRIN